MSGPVKLDIAASHKNRIGCSSIAQALGVSRWGTPYQLWERYTGRAPWPDICGELRVALGEPMEDVLRPFIEQRLGCELRRDRKEYLHPNLPLIGHVDFRANVLAQAVIDALGRPALKRPVVDCKTSLGWGSRVRFGADGSDEVDFDVMLQKQGYLMLTGAEIAFVAALVPGPELKIFTILADAEIQTRIADGISEFWWHVQNDIPPPVQTPEDAFRRWPQHEKGKTVVADDEALSLAAELRSAKARIKEAEIRATEMELALKSRIGDSESLVDSTGKPLCIWKTQSASRIDTTALKAAMPDIAAQFTKTTPSRVFRLAQEK